MELSNILSKASVSADLAASSKEDVLKEMLTLVAPEVADQKDVMKLLVDRENLGSTGIGQGIAVPHAKVPGLGEIRAAMGISKQGIDFNSLDGEPVYIFFLLLAPKDCPGPHLKALARISRILRDPGFCGVLRKAEDVENIYRLLMKEDGKKE